MKTQQYIVKDEAELKIIAQTLLSQYSEQRIFAFRGDLGAGKTTFIKVLCELLKVIDSTGSPSFAVINEYRTIDDSPVYHFDFYRIKNIEEAVNLGCEDYFYSGNYCFIEWPEMIEELLDETVVNIRITIQNKNRILEF